LDPPFYPSCIPLLIPYLDTLQIFSYSPYFPLSPHPLIPTSLSLTYIPLFSPLTIFLPFPSTFPLLSPLILTLWWVLLPLFHSHHYPFHTYWAFSSSHLPNRPYHAFHLSLPYILSSTQFILLPPPPWILHHLSNLDLFSLSPHFPLSSHPLILTSFGLTYIPLFFDSPSPLILPPLYLASPPPWSFLLSFIPTTPPSLYIHP